MVQTQQKEHPEARKCWKQRERRNEELGSQSGLHGDLGWGQEKRAPPPSTSGPSDMSARCVVEREFWTSGSGYLGSVVPPSRCVTRESHFPSLGFRASTLKTETTEEKCEVWSQRPKSALNKPDSSSSNLKTVVDPLPGAETLPQPSRSISERIHLFFPHQHGQGPLHPDPTESLLRAGGGGRG